MITGCVVLPSLKPNISKVLLVLLLILGGQGSMRRGFSSLLA